jgi:hypothetical protein
MTEAEIKRAVEGHDARNAALRISLAKDGVDVNIPRDIDCQFWVSSRENAFRLASVLGKQGLRVKSSRKAVTNDEALPWNLEMVVRQSIELTLRHEFADELVRAAAACDARFDGWGTAI